MKKLEMYRGYQLYIPRGYKKRIFVAGPRISSKIYFYSVDRAKKEIDFIIKYVV